MIWSSETRYARAYANIFCGFMDSFAYQELLKNEVLIRTRKVAKLEEKLRAWFFSVKSLQDALRASWIVVNCDTRRVLLDCGILIFTPEVSNPIARCIFREDPQFGCLFPLTLDMESLVRKFEVYRHDYTPYKTTTVFAKDLNLTRQMSPVRETIDLEKLGYIDLIYYLIYFAWVVHVPYRAALAGFLAAVLASNFFSGLPAEMFQVRSTSLDLLLSAFWLSSTLAAVFSAFPISVINKWTKHGKLIRGADDSGFVPKKWFTHFYVYAVLVTWLLSPRESSGRFWVLLHLWRRLIEQAVLFPSSERSKMHVSAYLFGFFFYTAVALTVPAEPGYPILSVAGNAIQFFSHHALFMRRWTRRSEEVKKSPPESMWFKYMNCPHYFAEMLIYAGLVARDNTPSILCLLFVCVSLGVNWRNHSLFYKHQLARTSPRKTD